MTVDVWCNPKQNVSPGRISFRTDGPNGKDPCEVYMSLESSAGCVYYDTVPIMRVVGLLMIAGGAGLNIFAVYVNRAFMLLLVQASAFLFFVAVFSQMHYFAYFDPTSPNEIQGIALALVAVGIAVAGAVFCGRFA